MNSLVEQYTSQIAAEYPQLVLSQQMKDNFSYLLCDQVLVLPKSVLDRATHAIRSIYRFAHSKENIQNLKVQYSSQPQSQYLNHTPKNSSVLMGYDFHYDFDSDRLALIEINTNASAFLIADLLYKTKKISSSNLSKPLELLKKSFDHELDGLNIDTDLKIAIIDEEPQQQKLFIEFLMYQNLFNSWGWPTDIYDINELEYINRKFIYNRCTDFYLDAEKLHSLKTAYLNDQVRLSPNPREYILLSDKSRLVDFYSAGISESIPYTEILGPKSDKDKIWANRKKLFFKPRNSFGSRATYRGSSISRKYFDNIFSADFIAQEFVPAGELGDWKFDLRFFAYQDEIQLYCGRVYQGQVTNFSKIGGGISCVSFKES